MKLAMNGRGSVAIVLVAVVWLGGCGGPTVSAPDPSAPHPTRTTGPTVPTSTPTATQSAAASGATEDPVTPEGYRRIILPSTDVQTVTLVDHFRFHRIDSDGPLVVVDQGARPPFTTGRSIYLVDLAAGTTSALREAPEGFRAWIPAISGRRVAWIEWHYEGPDNSGALEWHIIATDIDGASTWTVASGVQRRAGASFGAAWPALDLDGDRLAYAIEDPARAPSGWKILVVSVPGGIVERVIPTDLPVYDLALDRADVAWTEGRTDPGIGFTYDTRLMVSAAAQPAPREIARNAFEVAFGDGRLAWSQDAPTRVTGAAEGTRIWTASPPDFRAEPASPEPGHGTEQRQAYPATGDGFVTWQSYRFSETDVSVLGDRFCVWDPARRTAFELLDVRPVGPLGSVGGGWFVWLNERLEPPTVSGIRIADAGLP